MDETHLDKYPDKAADVTQSLSLSLPVLDCCFILQQHAWLTWWASYQFASLNLRSPASVGGTDRRVLSGVHIDLKLDLHSRLRLSTPEELLRLSKNILQVSTARMHYQHATLGLAEQTVTGETSPTAL